MDNEIRNLRGIVLRYEKGSMEDGDGMRTVIYMKGCPLHCWWCSTPESHRFEPEVAYAAVRCVGCQKCVMVCPAKALSLNDSHKVVRDKQKCTNCFHCVDACPYSAQKIYGAEKTVQETIDLIAQDEVLYFFTGGGVTFGGGECLGQADFVAEVMKGCRNRGINTCMETTVVYPWEEVEKVLPYVDVMYIDLKVMDPALHRKFVGGSIERIQENIRRIDRSAYPVKLRIRVPTLSSVNGNEENMKKMAEFCRELKKIEYIELLPYHRLGMVKYEETGRTYQLPDEKTPSAEEMSYLAECIFAQGTGIPVMVSGVKYK